MILTHTLILFVCISTSPVLGLPQGAPLIDKVVVIKHERTLRLLSKGKVVKTYKVALGSEPVGPKRKEGDHRTPEGTYVLDSRNAHSRFYKSIHISYPNPQDKARAAAAHVSTGGEVYVHGLPNGYGAVGAVASIEGLDRRLYRRD